VSSRLLWSHKPVSYREAHAGDLTRRIREASARRELREFLLEGLRVHRVRKRLAFLRLHRRPIYRILLTPPERAFVREETCRLRPTEFFFRRVRVEEGEEAVKELATWSHHLNPFHFPSSECGECYALLLDVVLRRREAAAAVLNGHACRRPRPRGGVGERVL
jgi:hypothetical protein